MSECVVRMEMPENCRLCPLCQFIGASPACALKKYTFDTVSQYYYADKKPSNCPITCTLPEEHGRLVDADKLADDMKARKAFFGRMSDPQCLVEDAPTIVPADTEERSEA